MIDHITKIRIPPLLKWNDKKFDQTIFITAPRRCSQDDRTKTIDRHVVLQKSEIQSMFEISPDNVLYRLHGDAKNYVIILHKENRFTELFDDGFERGISLFITEYTFKTLHDYVFGCPEEYWAI